MTVSFLMSLSNSSFFKCLIWFPLSIKYCTIFFVFSWSTFAAFLASTYAGLRVSYLSKGLLLIVEVDCGLDSLLADLFRLWLDLFDLPDLFDLAEAFESSEHADDGLLDLFLDDLEVGLYPTWHSWVAWCITPLIWAKVSKGLAGFSGDFYSYYGFSGSTFSA